ncbi:MAG: hypothetical protein HQM04_00275 [Magnetococcales bacterium]|nr:hypothetical protein [Magnetococcales bacterium]MBF0113457.1 hypothetical protein [Magnetococcales bacterium]
MDEWSKYTKLTNLFIECYVDFYTTPLLLGRCENDYREDESAWKLKRDAVVQRIRRYLEVGSRMQWEGVANLMRLSALDEALYEAGMEDMVYRDLPPRHKVRGREWLVFKRAVSLSSKHAHVSQRGHLRNWLRHHMIVPAFFEPYPVVSADQEQYKLKIVVTHSNRLARDLRIRIGSELRVWLGTFPDGVVPEWPGIGQKKCTSERLDDPDERWLSIRTSLEQAKMAAAHIVIMPELSLCRQLRNKMLEWLDQEEPGFLLVVPGSYHEVDDLKIDKYPFNRSRLCDGSGNEILRHDKLRAFGSDKLCHEQITPGNKVTLWRTSIGVFTLLICRDFCEEDGDVVKMLEALAPDWLLVPSMSFDHGIRAHALQAKHLHNKCGARILLANQTPDKTFASEESHGFVYPAADGACQPDWVSPAARLKILSLP